MRKKKLIKEIERLENIVDQLEGAIDSYRADLSTLETKYLLKEDELAVAEDQLQTAKANATMFKEALFKNAKNFSELENQLHEENDSMFKLMDVIKFANIYQMSFKVEGCNLRTVVKLNCHDIDNEHYTVKFGFNTFCIEDVEGLNGFISSGNYTWSISGLGIEIFDEDGELKYIIDSDGSIHLYY